MKKRLLLHIAALCLFLFFSGNRATAQTCTDLVSNGDFATVTNTSGTTQFCMGYVTSWETSHGSPQILGSPAFYAHMWSDGYFGEGISTNVSITSGKKYVLTYKYRKASVSPGDVDHAYVKLTLGSYSYPFTCSAGNPPPSPSTQQTIDHLTNISNTSWATSQVCFTATNNYGKVFLYPEKSVYDPNNAQWLDIDDVSIVEFDANAGTDQNACSSVIGPSCDIPGVTYSWSPSTGLSNPNVRNPTATPTSATNYTLTITGPNGCSDNDVVTVTPLACCLTANFNTTVISPCGIQFHNNSTALTGTILGYEWDFGDGTTSTETNPLHFFENAIAYNVCLTVVSYTGTQCCTDQYCMTVTSPCANNTCNISPTFSVNPVSGNPCKYTFNANTISPTNSRIMGYYWTFGDGTTGSGSSIEHTFPTSGTFNVCVTAIGLNSAGCCTGQYCFNVNVTGCNVVNDRQQNPSTGDQQGSKDELLKIYPNPTTHNTTLEYSVNKEGAVNILVFDIQGKVMKNVVNNEQHKAGVYSMELTSAEFPAGTYICRVQINDAMYTEKVIVIK